MAWELLYCTRVLLYASVYNMYYYAKEKGEEEREKKDEQREKKLQMINTIKARRDVQYEYYR